jgi:hypothetical protein
MERKHFKVIDGSTVTEYGWEKSANLVNDYRNAFCSLIQRDRLLFFRELS